MPEQTQAAPEQTHRVAESITGEMRKAIVGQDAAIEHMVCAVLAGGHVLLEGVPGTAKTLMVRALAHVVDCQFTRVQLTPDLMPSDIIGTNVFQMHTSTFELRRGPVFTTLLLADEINRAPAKTQSALLEAMQERQVTIDGVLHRLPDLFTVFATQNPIEYEGTYPLPEAQLDRFMFKVMVDYPSADSENQMLLSHHEGFDPQHLEQAGLQKVANADAIGVCQEEIQHVVVEEGIISYISAITRGTRESPTLLLGCSPRASVMLLLASKALAAMRGRGYVIPDDVKYLAFPALRHRVLLRPEADIEGLTGDDAIASVLQSLEVPR
ncbi:MAG: AAA family ATPase [Armatimonadota bacterium]